MTTSVTLRNQTMQAKAQTPLIRFVEDLL